MIVCCMHATQVQLARVSMRIYDICYPGTNFTLVSNRYIMKEDCMPDSLGRVQVARVPWMCGGLTLAILQDAKIAYRQRAVNYYSHKTLIEPSTAVTHMTKHKDRKLRPLRLVVPQVVRCMLLSGEYALGGRWPLSTLFLTLAAFPTAHALHCGVLVYRSLCTTPVSLDQQPCMM